MNTQEKLDLLERKINSLTKEMKSGSNQNQRILLKMYTDKQKELKKQLNQ